jgi:hypothetical protein
LVPEVPGELNKINNKRESATVTVNATEIRPLPITEILIGVVVVVAVVATIVLIRKRRKKPSPEET